MNKNQPKKRRSRLLALFGSSLILCGLSRLADWVYRMMARSLAGGFFTGYDRAEEKAEEGFFAWIGRKLDGVAQRLRPIRLGIMRGFEQSCVLQWIRARLCGLLGKRMRLYGTFFLSFGLYSMLMYGVRYFLKASPGRFELYTGAVTALLALPMLFSGESLARTVLSGRILSWLLFSVIGARREGLESIEESDGKSTAFFIAGMVVGLCGFFVPNYLILALAVLLGAALSVLMIPECGVVAMIFLVPFMGYLPHPSILTALMLLYVIFCYFLKLIRGKRALRFDLLDRVVLLFGVFMLCGGLVSAAPGAGLRYALLYCCYLSGYFLVVNLIRTREWVYRCLLALLSSGTLVSLYGIYQYFFGGANTTWQDEEMFTEISGRVVSTLENPNVLAEYLIMLLPVAVALFFTARGKRERIGALAAGAAGLGCLIYTWSRGAWLGFMIAILLFMLIYTRKTMIVVLLGVFSLPVLPFVLPDSIIQRFASIGNMADSSTAYRVHIWQGAIAMIRDFWTSGIGVGPDVFAQVYPFYTLAGIESAPHSHNLYLQILIEMGVGGLIAFVAAMVIFVQSVLTFYNRPESGMRRDQVLSVAVMCGALAVLAQGMTDYIWYNYRIYLIFWIMVGLGSAIRRSSVDAFGSLQVEKEAAEHAVETERS